MFNYNRGGIYGKQGKTNFRRNARKTVQAYKKTLLSVFCGTGAVFVVIAIILFCLATQIELPIVFLSMGLFLLVAGIIMYFAVPTKYSYDKFKSRVNKYGYMNIYEMSAKIIELEERIEKLESNNKE